MLGLILSMVNCFAEGLTVENSFVNYIEITITESNTYSGGSIIVGGSSRTITPPRELHLPGLYRSSKANEVAVSLNFLDPETKSTHLIDEKEFKAVTGGTHGKKTYKKEFFVGGQRGWVQYALNIEFGAGKDLKMGNVLKTLEVVILQASIPGVEKVEL